MNTAHPRILQGQADVPLNATGVRQAVALGWRLKKYKFNHLYSSDLTRAKQTCDEIHKHQEGSAKDFDRRLREQDLGDLTGMTWPDAKKVLKTENKTFDEYVAAKGESTATFRERIIAFYADLIEKHLVQPHAELLKMGSQDLLQLDEAADRQLRERAEPLVTVPGQVPDTSVARPTTTNHSKTNTSGSQQQKQQPHQPQYTSAQSSPTNLQQQQQKPGPATSAAPLAPRMRQFNVLVVTHGGWIQEFMRYLIDDLNFDIDGEPQLGFPKNSSVYRVAISKIWKEDGDYEWEGRITTMNCVSHLAGLTKKMKEAGSGSSISLSNLNGQSPFVSPGQSPLVPRKFGGGGENGGKVMDKAGLVQQQLAATAAAGKVSAGVAEQPKVPALGRRSLGW
ncbi:hypothetical protein HK102_003113 [Quaeritorhiza haematococci]|nr:hypothetical protein HK102_003113 [Quaeritorhiza haematococci]